MAWPVAAATSSRTPAASTWLLVVEATSSRSWAGRSEVASSAPLGRLAAVVRGTGPPVTPRSRAEVARRRGMPGVAPRGKTAMGCRSGAGLWALGRVEVAARGTVPRVRPRSTEVGAMRTAVEEMGAVVMVAGGMGMVEGVTVEEETVGVAAATAARTSCS